MSSKFYSDVAAVNDYQSAGGDGSVQAGTVHGTMSNDDLPVCGGLCQSVVQPGLHNRVVVSPFIVRLRVDHNEVNRVIADVRDVIVPQVRLVPARIVLR